MGRSPSVILPCRRLRRLVYDFGHGPHVRIIFHDETQSATFSNVNVRTGAAHSGAYVLEVAGNANVTIGLLVSGGDIDLTGNNLTNVTQLESSESFGGTSYTDLC